jgi:hypothetical protein
MHRVNPASIPVHTPGGSAVGGGRKRSWELKDDSQSGEEEREMRTKTSLNLFILLF